MKLTREQYYVKEHSLNCWHNWNEHAPDAYFDYNTFITGYRYWTILWILQLWIIHNDMTLFTVVDWLNM